MVHGEVDIPIKVGTQTFDSTFYGMDIRPSFSCLLGRPWIHNTGVVTSTLHQMLKYPTEGEIITVHGEEEYVLSHLNSFRHVELDAELIENPFQHFEEVPQTVAVTKTVSQVLKITRPPLKMSSLKDAKPVIKEGGCTIWGQLPDIPYKSDKFGLGFTSGAQKVVRCARAGGPALKTRNHRVNIVEDDEDIYVLEEWIFPTDNGGLSNWEAKDFVPITFIQQ